MELTWWWLGLALALALSTVTLWRWLTALRRRRPHEGVTRDHAERLRALPRYRELAAAQVRWLTVHLCCLLLASAGVVMLASRLAAVNDDAREMRSRDIVLCLDVSGSMKELDADVLRSYADLVHRFRGERIGLVVFDAAAATVFPLTDDYSFIDAQFASMSEQLRSDRRSPVLEATGVGERGTSLIGDGLASCVQRFDKATQDRPRTIVLATDNAVEGTPFFTVAAATDRAVDKHVMVFGVGPAQMATDNAAELRTQTARTGGDLLTMDEPDANTRIVAAVERRQKQAILALPRTRSFDLVWPGAVLFAAGLAGAVLTARRAYR